MTLTRKKTGALNERAPVSLNVVWRLISSASSAATVQRNAFTASAVTSAGWPPHVARK
jgi:hypothetical protein